MVGWTDVERARFAGFSPWVRVPEFALGAFLGWCHVDGRLRIPRPALVASVLVVVLMGILTIPALVASNPYFHNSGLSLLYGGIVLSLAQDRSRLRDTLSNPVLLFLGEASYALYILHYPVWAWMEWGARKTGTLDLFQSPAGLGIYLVAALLAAAAAYRWLETPARRWMRGRS
jgi:peptidoglycan/LPS O-acetylase OafA/YrhL